MKQTLTTFLFGVFSLTAFAQETEVEIKVIPKEIQTPQAYLDSIKKTFVNHKAGANIDKKWINELLNDEMFENMESDINSVYLDQEVAYDLSTDVLKTRLAQLDKKYPFDIKYSPTLEKVIKNFLKNRSKSFERLMAVSEYYFPMFEEQLAKRNVPIEIKYLAIVESALNPKAKSRVGATGLWQFMYPTGKQYGLEVNSYVDERSDPLKSTDAASKYLADLYDVFGNWEMVLASYNSGPGTVSKAIRRSGGKTNYWEIREYLPKETQGYVPAFLATLYIYEYHKVHGIVPKKATLPFIKTDTIHLKQAIAFDEISELLDISIDEIKLLNPKYKLDYIPNYDQERHSLRLPIDKISRFTSNEKKIYAYLDYQKNYKLEKNIVDDIVSEKSTAIAATQTKSKAVGLAKTHVVKKGDTLSSIAKKYGNVTVAQLMKKNNIKNASSLKPGMKLKI
ncbi:lytic transglycosylase domain-containing protein [Flavobacterium sp. I3-2]|uniref:lytic transglycosylase domain-containing protein n=1 Tax=Flavobacterium sp. I3-2 TaxID=2748319 RepID=UPI0015AF7939|nr:lytic transglycosylase domain-containing protein [Flavobacterium sp. I3-2]